MPADITIILLIYLAVLGLSAFFSFAINWILLKFSLNLGMRNVNQENMIRWASSSKPALGGISFFIVFLLAVSLYGILPFTDSVFFNKQTIALLGACTLGFIIGLADDAYNTNPLVKFIGQFVCANIITIMDIYIPLTPYLSINYFFTMLWVIGLMNSINMLDNMDGITASISATIILGALGLVFIDGKSGSAYPVILVAVLGSILGFLFYNWNPSKMYMGDSGSQFLGVFLATISILFMWQFRDSDNYTGFLSFRQFVVPMLIFIVPLIDTMTVVIRRIARKQSPFVGGKDHITHNLVYLGLTEKQVAWVLIGLSLTSIGYALALQKFVTFWEVHFTVSAFAFFGTTFFLIQYFYQKAQEKLNEKQSG